MKVKVEPVSQQVLSVRVQFKSMKDRFELLCLSDIHWDNRFCDRRHLKECLDEALKRGAYIIENGDGFCAMQGKYDPRSSKEALRPEHCRDDYLDALVETRAEFLEPYAKNLILLGDGNHETNIKKRHGVDLNQQLASRLRQFGSPVACQGYTGWVRFLLDRAGQRKRLVMFRHHGAGGNSPVTRGVLDVNRLRSYVDADMYWVGHKHKEWALWDEKLSLSEAGRIHKDPYCVFMTPGFKDEWGDGQGGYAVEKGMAPSLRGGAWLTIYPKAISGTKLFRFNVTRTD